MFKSYGIHTRLNYVIARSGGYNPKMSLELLKEKFPELDEVVGRKIARYSDVHTSIEEIGLEKTIQNVLDKEEKEAKKWNTMKCQLDIMASSLGVNTRRFGGI
ncbi:MAG: hypothetical protein ACRCX8_06795 [Sarcina sp.]